MCDLVIGLKGSLVRGSACGAGAAESRTGILSVELEKKDIPRSSKRNERYTQRERRGGKQS